MQKIQDHQVNLKLKKAKFSKNKSAEYIGPPPPFDQELITPLQNALQRLTVPLTNKNISLSRELTISGSLSDEEIRCNGKYDFEERIIPGPIGAPDIPIIICRPTKALGPYAVIYNIHGGGMVAGNNRTAELACELKRAEELNLAIVSINYRLAPENPDPAPLEDCYAGLIWLAKNAEFLNIDSQRIIISGNSAGGGLAAGTTLLVRDRGGPKLISQMLQCPMLDDRNNSISARQMKGVGLWDTISNMTGWTALLGSRRGSKKVSYYAAPARCTDLSGLPPTFIDVGSVEALRDEAVAYASRIWQCGGEAELHVWGGAFHSFDQWAPEAIISKSADNARIVWMRRVLKM